MGLNHDIDQHEKRVFSGAEPYTVICRRCQEKSEFVRHDVRRRTFCSRDGGDALTVRSWIARWKCTNCQFRFTDYPPFALPNKQFVKSTVFELVSRFVDDFFDRITYRSASCLESHVDDEQGPSNAQSICSHATVWRWMSWLDRLRDGAAWALRILQQEHPSSSLHRRSWSVQPWKYRSEERGVVLRSARRSLHHFIRFEATPASPKLEQAPT